ncbi:MAG: nucleotidyltransferase [Lachnospiraceae bacterium]
MKTVGIIAEYNPFHNGHLYQLEQAKKLSGADFIIVILSGDFTQRGTPALVDKYARCEMALLGGADLVIELPTCYATGSAEYFAKGAVSILDSLSVDALCFGSECGSIDALGQVAHVLAEEPEDYKLLLRENLKRGMSFPAARSLALEQYSGLSGAPAACDASLLQSPNNILGVEYLKALYRRNSSMEVYTVPREGAGYLDTDLDGDSFCSALAIRQCIFDGGDVSRLSAFMPCDALRILKRELDTGYPVSIEDFSSMLFYRLLSLQQEGYTAFADVTEALSDKIRGQLMQYCSCTPFCDDLLKSKDLTRTRLNRCLLHILLDIRKQDMEAYADEGDAFYARILGFRKSSEELFCKLRASSLPLISKMADSSKQLSPLGLKQLSTDIFAAHLYDSIRAQKTGSPIQNEYRRQILIIP